MILKNLIDQIETKYPTSLAESWDHVGLMVGDTSMEIHRIYLALEANESVIEDAIQKQADLIITHHPFLFKKINQVTTDDFKGRLIYKLIQNNLALYSMHTNFDIAFDGMNDYFMKLLGHTDCNVLELQSNSDYNTNDHTQKQPGLGRICTLDNEITLESLCTQIKEMLGMNQIRLIGNPCDSVKTIAVVTGAGADYVSLAKSSGAQVLITGDMKYHEAQDVIDSKMSVIDCGHFESENIFKDAMAEYLSKATDLEIIKSTVNINPFCYL